MPRSRLDVRPLLRLAWLLVVLGSGASLAQECRIETEPNDTPGQAVAIAPYLCLVGELAGEDQDAFVWEVDEAAAMQEWTIQIQGIPGQLTKLDVLDVEFTEDGSGVAGFETVLSWGTEDGRPTTSEPFRIAPGRYVLGCNGHKVPLTATGTNGEYIAGVRFRAWKPASALHPTVDVDAPLVFDLFDTWNGRAVTGCTYHVAHPGGRNFEHFPVNAYEAESRRLARFFEIGHTAGHTPPPDAVPNAEFPMTLDLRRAKTAG